MAGTVYLCCTDQRRAALDGNATVNGIDYLEVADLAPTELDAAEAAEYAALPAGERDRLLWQRRLTVVFVNALTAAQKALLTADHLRVVGGERADSRNIGVAVLSTGAHNVVLRATRAGDFSVYRLAVVTSVDDPAPPAVFDPILSAVDFSFKVECPTDFDCAPVHECPPDERPAIDLDYLARDYASFRRLMLDRMSVLAPDWRDRNAADLGVTLVELMAYVGDYLAYRQDAVATEAYLGTARLRTSVRRHARLVDYPMHDGCNARAWIHLVAADNLPAAGALVLRVDPVTGVPTRFLTRVTGSPAMTVAEADDAIVNQRPEVFEPMADVRIFEAHNELAFHTWGADDCCLPRDATRATLRGDVDTLAAGDLLLLEEVAGPKKGANADADPAHRHVVRLRRVWHAIDPLAPAPGDVTQLEWDSADALPFPLCISATVVNEGGTTETKVTAVARGNIVLADHGLTVVERIPEAVPGDEKLHRFRPAGDACDTDVEDPIPPRYAPVLGRRPLTYASEYDPLAPSATSARTHLTAANPKIELRANTGDPWDVRRDLLRSGPTSSDFVVELDSDDVARLRFGDGRHGARPVAETRFTATYRVGNGTRGNVGREAISHVAPNLAGVKSVRNPLPAAGGHDPEPVENVRRFAPVAFMTQERAVTADDYARMAERHPQVQRAAGTFRWTGSWRTAFVTVDPLASVSPDDLLEPAMPVHLEPYRMAGHDVRADLPRYVPLDIEMTVCARRDYFRADVKRALLDVFSARRLRSGGIGIFHPDNFSFGQPLYLSRLYAAAYEVDGVESVQVTTFRRQGTPDAAPLAAGKLEFDRLEIARLENDPSLPERGLFRISVEGGK